MIPRIKIFPISFFVCFLAGLLLPGYVLAETCYMGKEGFAVVQPFMVTRGCLLFNHGANVDLENQSDLIIASQEELHPDPLHSEFLHFIIDRKLISLKKGTPLFSCDYDLQTIARDFKQSGNKAGATRTLGYSLPEFNCAGTTSMWVPVRPIRESHCFWIAVPLLRCDDFGSELKPMSTTDSPADEK